MADARAAATAASVSAVGAVGAGAPPQPRSLHPELQADLLARLFLSIAGIVVAHGRGQFALDCWQLRDVCRETRFVVGVTQPGTVADLIFHGCRLSGVSKLLEEARTCKRVEHVYTRDTAQLLRAVWNNDVERVRQLFRLGCPTVVVNAQDADGRTALFWASGRGHEAVVRELLAHGADVNIKDKDGWTPLLEASCEGHLAVVRLLCDVPGIDLVARSCDSTKLTALRWALRHNHAEVATFLRSRGAPK